MEILNYHVSDGQSGIRIDLYLSEKNEKLSRSYIQKLLKEQKIMVNGSPVKANYKVQDQDDISLEVPDMEEPDILPGIEFAQRLAQVGTLAPPEGLLLTADQHLDVDIGVVYFEFGIRRFFQLRFHYVDIDVLAVEFMDPRLHRFPVGRSDEAEGFFQTRAHRIIERAVLQRVENHSLSD